MDDLCGLELYQRLGLQRSASAADVRAAFRAAARVHHPDKGGDAKTFGALRAAFEARVARLMPPAGPAWRARCTARCARG